MSVHILGYTSPHFQLKMAVMYVSACVVIVCALQHHATILKLSASPASVQWKQFLTLGVAYFKTKLMNRF